MTHVRRPVWVRRGNIWYMDRMPEITVQPIRFGPATAWQACFKGKPVKAISPALNSRDEMELAYEYFDRRINL